MKRILPWAVLGFLLFLAYLLQSVRVPLTDEDLKSFNVPIEQRTDRDFYLEVFQKKNGRWHQCKTRLSRLFFS